MQQRRRRLVHSAHVPGNRATAIRHRLSLSPQHFFGCGAVCFVLAVVIATLRFWLLATSIQSENSFASLIYNSYTLFYPLCLVGALMFSAQGLLRLYGKVVTGLVLLICVLALSYIHFYVPWFAVLDQSDPHHSSHLASQMLPLTFVAIAAALILIVGLIEMYRQRFIE